MKLSESIRVRVRCTQSEDRCGRQHQSALATRKHENAMQKSLILHNINLYIYIETYRQLASVFALHALKKMVHQLSLHMKNYQIVQIQRYV